MRGRLPPRDPGSEWRQRVAASVMSPVQGRASADRPTMLWPSPRNVAVVGCLSVLLGGLLVHGGLIVGALLIALPVLGWLIVARPGIAVAGLWLAALNGIPLIDIQSGVGEFKPTDLAVAGLVLMAVIHWVVSPGTRRRLPRGLAIACALFGGWWFITFARSLDVGIPAVDAFFFGRDLLSFVVIIPAAWIVLSRPAAWRECVAVVLAGTGIYALAYVASALGLVDASSFTHPQQIIAFGSVQRLYTPMNDLVVAVAVFSVAVLATTRRTRATPWVTALAAITLLAFLLQLTRAAYLSVGLGMLLAIVIALTHGSEVRWVLLQRVAIVLMAGGIFYFATTGFASTSIPTSVVSQRISTGVGEVEGTSGNFGYRVTLYHEMVSVLGSQWPVGLGFLHPKDRYFSSLPGGSIRNGDVGLMNAVMTMGVVGLALIFGMLIAVAGYVARTREHRPPWMVVGLFAWVVVLAAGSPTLVTLFSTTGILSTALILVLCGVEPSAAGAPQGRGITSRRPGIDSNTVSGHTS